jgi:hypothetical protein
MELFELDAALVASVAHRILSASDQGSFTIIEFFKKRSIMKKQYITGKNYDLGKGEIGRMTVMLLRGKIIPLGNLGGGARLKGLLVLLLSHFLGRIIFPWITPFEHHLHRLYLRLK